MRSTGTVRVLASLSTASRSSVRALRELLPRPDDLVAMRRNPRQDLVAGLTVAIVALPLALAFGVASGLGAQAGLATAVGDDHRLSRDQR